MLESVYEWVHHAQYFLIASRNNFLTD
uniref:Uncharacterized protein n=1 Tax=Arundo donax TaxID=35708 RepID=A0A0A9H3C9_ARUDO